MNMPILPESLKAELLAIDPANITVNEIARLFGYTTKKGSFDIAPPRIDPRAKVHLEPGEYINTDAVDTNAGIVLFNKLMVEEPGIQSIIPGGFYNEVITKKQLGKIMKLLGDAVRNDKIPLEPAVTIFLRNYENWGLRLVPIFSPSYSMGMVKPNKKMREETERRLKNADLTRTEDMIELEDELVGYAHKVTAGEAGKTLFDSGSRGSFENDFKNMALFIGPTQNPVTGKYDFMTSNYMSGQKKEDLVAAGNITVNAEYPKAIGTARGGYITKQIYAVLQTLIIDEDGTDCGTKSGLRTTLTKENINQFIDLNIMTTKGPMVITEENAPKLIGKKALIRTPMGCTGEKICSVCAGRSLYKVGIFTMGLLMTTTSNNMLKKNMKLRHSMKMAVNRVDVDKLIL